MSDFINEQMASQDIEKHVFAEKIQGLQEELAESETKLADTRAECEGLKRLLADLEQNVDPSSADSVAASSPFNVNREAIEAQFRALLDEEKNEHQPFTPPVTVGGNRRPHIAVKRLCPSTSITMIKTKTTVRVLR